LEAKHLNSITFVSGRKQMNLPNDFRERMTVQLDSSFDDFSESLKQPPPVSIRVNPFKYSIENNLKHVPWCRSGFYLSERPIFTLDPLFHAGTYYVQEASSMFLEQAIVQSVEINKPINVLDLCAAPGGKSTHLLSLLNKESLLVSNEVIRSRAQILHETVTKWGNSNVIITNNDSKDFSSLKNFFDLVVVDAPCSGEGLFRKEPNAMREWSLQNVELCYRRQRRILADIWPSLKENGILVYCTCTYNRSENEDNLQWLRSQKNLEFIDLNINKEWGIERTDEKNVIGYRFYPHRVDGEGFFLTAIRKLEREEEGASPSKKSRLIPLKKNPPQLSDWIVEPDVHTFFQWGETINFIPVNKTNEAKLIVEHLSVVSAGTSASTMKHEKTIPDHSLAMSHFLNREKINSLELSLNEALEYLRRNSIRHQNSQKGFALATYKSIPLGWVNVLKDRINNLYPSNWRIRMSGQ
jgi:16S rRNA C967 or C1407 C5-methylase (RsmB/RsmF family)/NOL1/NOP2/fmu family ribosome biogenesis protein